MSVAAPSNDQSARMINAVMRIQALFRGRQSREAVGKPQLARLKAAAGLGLPTMARLARLAKARSADFIAELESEASVVPSRQPHLFTRQRMLKLTVTLEYRRRFWSSGRFWTKEEKLRQQEQKDEQLRQKQLREKETRKGKPLSETEKQQLDEFAFTPEEQALFEGG